MHEYDYQLSWMLRRLFMAYDSFNAHGYIVICEERGKRKNIKQKSNFFYEKRMQRFSVTMVGLLDVWQTV